jgi:hypothetical protein
MGRAKMSMKTETFFLDSEEDALKFIAKCAEEGITATLLPAKKEDGRLVYPVKVKYHFTNYAKED